MRPLAFLNIFSQTILWMLTFCRWLHCSRSRSGSFREAWQLNWRPGSCLWVCKCFNFHRGIVFVRLSAWVIQKRDSRVTLMKVHNFCSSFQNNTVKLNPRRGFCIYRKPHLRPAIRHATCQNLQIFQQTTNFNTNEYMTHFHMVSDSKIRTESVGLQE